MFESISVKFNLTIVAVIRAAFGLLEERRDKLEVRAVAGIVEWLQKRMDVAMAHPERIGLVGDLVSTLMARFLDPEGIEALIEGIPEELRDITLCTTAEWSDENLEVIFKAKQVGLPTMMSGFEMEMPEEDIVEMLGKAAKVVGPLPAIFRNGAAEIFIAAALRKIGATDIDVTVK